MAIRVGRIPYLSCEPFYFDMERRGIELVDLTPREVASALGSGDIAAGPVPLSDFFRLEKDFPVLSGFCLATIAQTTSVNLYSKLPVAALSGASIGITGEAAASCRLLQVLLSLKHRVKPGAYVTLEDPHDARLLIGNQGLRNRGGLRDFPHKYDLGEEWHQWTGLPFVFARWLVRPNVEHEDRVALEDSLFVSLQDWADGLFRVTGPREGLRMHPQQMLEYTQRIRYFMGVPEQKAVYLFRQYLAQLEE